eukprot:3779391-Amphidinium_carterae.1
MAARYSNTASLTSSWIRAFGWRIGLLKAKKVDITRPAEQLASDVRTFKSSSLAVAIICDSH